MNIQTLTGNRLFKLANHLEQRLYPGQILEGSILKLYPNNKAQIKLSHYQTLLAQLEASLNVGERYHFQVQANEQVLHLKVVGEALSHQTKDNAENLLKHFGYRVSKLNIDLVQTLMNERIPFDRPQLNKGVQFINLAEHKPKAVQTVKQMLTLQTPMTESIFNAFYYKNTNQLSPLMTELIQSLKQEQRNTTAHQPLRNVLERMIELQANPTSLKTQNTDSARPAIDRSISQSIQLIQELINKNEDFPRIKEEINRRIIPTLPNEWQQRVLNQIQTNAAHPKELFDVLNMLKAETQSSHIMTSSAKTQSIPLSLLKEQFITLINDYLQYIGTTDESRLKEAQQPSLSLRALLLQTVQQEADTVFKQQAQTLIHMLNGIQLQSINENQYFIQASLQMPGEKFELNEDIYIDFESKKTADGKVDADHARILFYLNLRYLKETVIDMQIQKRHVSIALYNDHKNINKKVELLQPLLEKKLKSLNYHLMTVYVKPLEQTKQMKNQLPRTQPLYKQEGIDFRV